LRREGLESHWSSRVGLRDRTPGRSHHIWFVENVKKPLLSQFQRMLLECSSRDKDQKLVRDVSEKIREAQRGKEKGGEWAHNNIILRDWFAINLNSFTKG
jgi:hypothetical protein